MNELIWQAQKGDKEAMSEIIENNIGLVWNIVKRFTNRGYEIEDLFQIGCIGFIKAIQRFDTNYETQLSTYAVPMIIGEIRRFLRDDGPIKISRTLKELAYKIEQIIEEERKNGNNEIDMIKLSKQFNVSKEDIVLALESKSFIESLDKESTEDDDRTLGEKLSNEKDEYEELISKLSINKVMEKLETKERKIILLRYFKYKTQTEIAESMGISQVQVSRIEKRALSKMKEMMC